MLSTLLKGFSLRFYKSNNKEANSIDRINYDKLSKLLEEDPFSNKNIVDYVVKEENLEPLEEIIKQQFKDYIPYKEHYNISKKDILMELGFVKSLLIIT